MKWSREGYDSETFIRVFMHSGIAEGLDSDFDYSQWAGKEYLMERMQKEYPEGFSEQGTVFDSETLYWAGYLYRYWHFYTGESSKEIYRQADADKQAELADRLMADPYFDGDETAAQLQQAIASLPDVQRTVFNLRYYDNMKYSEMSQLLDTTEGALKASYHIAVKKITEFFNQKD